MGWNKILILLIAAVLVFGCTSNSDAGANDDVGLGSGTTVVPDEYELDLSNLSACLASGYTIGDFDSCYINEAGKTNLDAFCDDVSADRKGECYAVIDSDEIPEAETVPFPGDEEIIGELSPISGAFIVGTPTLAPSSQFPIFQHNNIRFADVDDPLTVTAQIDNLGPNGKAYVVYKNSYNVGSEGWARVEMASTGGNNYSGTIPLDQITPATQFPNQLANGGFENWDSSGVIEDWAIGWAQIAGIEKETSPSNVVSGNSSMKLTYQPMFFNHVRGPNRGNCTPENSLQLKGSLSSDPFTVEGNYINFFAGSYAVNVDEAPVGTDYEIVTSTPWGGNFQAGYEAAVYHEDTLFKPRVQLIESSTGTVLEDSFIIMGNVIANSDNLLEYEWNVSEYVGKTVYLKVSDNTDSYSGLSFDGFIQLKEEANGSLTRVDFANNGDVLENINFELGTFEGWTTDNPTLWRLADINKFFRDLDISNTDTTYVANWWADQQADYSENSSRYWWVGGTKVFNQNYLGDGNVWVSSVGNHFNYSRQALFYHQEYPITRRLTEPTKRLAYVLETYGSPGLSTQANGDEFDWGDLAYLNNYARKEEARGRYMPTSIYTQYAGRAEGFFGTENDCIGTTCVGNTCDCGPGNTCEINIHNSWTTAVLQQVPYEFKYKAKTDGGKASAQVVLWCDYEGHRFNTMGVVDGRDWTLDVEGRGKVFAGMTCDIGPGPEWTECVGTMMPPAGVTQCGNFRFVTILGHTASGNEVWYDDMSFTPIFSGIQYYILVENDYGQFSDVFPEDNKNWGVSNGVFDMSMLSKAANFYAGDETWSDYIVKFKVKEIEPLGYQGYPWSLGALLFRATDEDNFYQLNFNVGHDLIDLSKIVNGRAEMIELYNPKPARFNGVIRDIPQRDYRPFYDNRTTRTTFESGEWYDVEVRLEGNRIKVVFDGVTVINETDSSFVRGKIGLTAFNSHVQFDDVVVTDLSGNVLFSDNFSSQGNWEAVAKAYGNAYFVATGQGKGWQTVLVVDDAPDVIGGTEYSLTQMPAKQIAITLTNSHKKCNYTHQGTGFSADKSTYHYLYLKGIKILDPQGNNILEDAELVDSDVYLAEYYWENNSSIASSKFVGMNRYGDLGYIVLELPSEKTVDKLIYDGIDFTNNSYAPYCNSAATSLPKGFKVEVIR